MPAALKVLSSDLAGSAEFRERFLHDCRIAAGLDEPAVIPILEAGFDGGILYVARKYVDGTDLATMLRDGPLSTEQVSTILEQVAAALHAAHREGLVHGDLKPTNVLVQSGTDRVYVTDFGMAPTSMDCAAPEHASTRRVDERADIYSLGRLLVACQQEIPPPLLPVAARALANEPADRYSTALEFAEACRGRLAATRPQPVPAEGPPVETASEHPGRLRWYVVAAAAIAVVGVATGVILTRGGDHRPAPTAGPSPSVRPLIAARLRDRLVPRQQTLTDRVRNATAAGSIGGIETAARSVGDEVERTESWLASLHPKRAPDRAVVAALVSALSAQRAYASSLANLAPSTAVTKDEAEAVVTGAARAEAAYRRLHHLAPHIPLMPLRREGQLRLLTLAAPPALYDVVAFTQGDGVRYRNTSAQWCGGAPFGDPCWKSVVPGAGASEGQRLRVYGYTRGAAVHGDSWWAEVRQTPAEYVPATFLRTGHAAAPP